MAEKYIIYTMGNKEINKAVQKVLFDKGYSWLSSGFITKHTRIGIGINFFDDRPSGHLVNINDPSDAAWKNFKEITFRELCELPDVDDKYEELANHLDKEIRKYLRSLEGTFPTTDSVDWCKVWEKLKPKLGLE